MFNLTKTIYASYSFNNTSSNVIMVLDSITIVDELSENNNCGDFL